MSKNLPKWPRALVPVVLVAILTFASTAPGQTPLPAAARDQAAVQAVTQALTAMGGAAGWSQISDAEVTGTCTASAQQGGGSANFRWTTEVPEFRYETDTANTPILRSPGRQRVRTLRLMTAKLRQVRHDVIRELARCISSLLAVAK
jgi:hypothetical protein